MWAEHHYQTFIHYPLHTGSRLHQFSKVLDPIDSHQFRPLPSCPHHIWAKSRPINASSQFVQRILDNKVSILDNMVGILVNILDNMVSILDNKASILNNIDLLLGY